MIQTVKRADLVDRTFAVTMVLKGLDGVLEIVGAFLLLIVSPSTINRILVAVTQHELSQDPHDFVATHALQYAQGLRGSTLVFGGIYLLSHGVVKVVLVAAVLRKQLWAYPWMITFLIVFIVYQLYRMTFAASIGLVALTLFDVIVTGLTYVEYQRHRSNRNAPV